jgi:hypothetical protein
MRTATLLLLAAILIFLAGCQPKETAKDSFREQSQKIAEEFIINSETYSMDGTDLKIKDSNTLRCEGCYVFLYDFTSSYSGYGNRTDKILAQVLTTHTISVFVQNGAVIQAVVDNKWDEIKQRQIQDFEKIKPDENSKIPIYYCSYPRPTNCLKEEDSVCSSDKRNHLNGCEACRKKSTKWYAKGECDKGYVNRVISDLTKGDITKESGQFIVLVGWNLEND